MVTIKAYTNLSQSKILSKILPLESADMYYDNCIYSLMQEIISLAFFLLKGVKIVGFIWLIQKLFLSLQIKEIKF